MGVAGPLVAPAEQREEDQERRRVEEQQRLPQAADRRGSRHLQRRMQPSGAGGQGSGSSESGGAPALAPYSVALAAVEAAIAPGPAPPPPQTASEGSAGGAQGVSPAATANQLEVLAALRQLLPEPSDGAGWAALAAAVRQGGPGRLVRPLARAAAARFPREWADAWAGLAPGVPSYEQAEE